MTQRVSRRKFISRIGKQAAVTGLALPVITKDLFARGKVSANERLRMGFIGIGGMGGGQLGNFCRTADVQILGVCDVYGEHRDRAKARVDDTYDNSDCATYTDFRELLDRDDIDIVLIATPDHWHTRIAISACQAGKDIYCQKPLTVCIDEGKALVKAARRYGTVFQVGSQQRSSDNFRYACELVRSGRIGKLHTVTAYLPGNSSSGGSKEADGPPPADLDWDMYLGPAPKVPFNPGRFLGTFRWFFDYSGGQMTDWGAHHMDIAHWGMDKDLSGPLSVEGTGVLPTHGFYETFSSFDVQFEYPNGVTLKVTNPERGTKFEGSDGWIQVWRGGMDANPKELLRDTLGPEDVHLYNSPGHERDWLDCVRTRKRPICDVEVGHRSVSVAHLGNIACRLGQKLNWDPVREIFPDDEEANRWLFRPYRAPWYL